MTNKLNADPLNEIFTNPNVSIAAEMLQKLETNIGLYELLAFYFLALLLLLCTTCLFRILHGAKQSPCYRKAFT